MGHTLTQGAEARFRELAGSGADPRAVAAIRELIVEGSDFDCYKINAFRLAERRGLPRREVLRAFLFAARLGVCDLSWNLWCPSCKGIPAYHKHLMALENTAHCALCRLDWQLDFEEQVEVSFTPTPEVRRIAYVDFKDRDFAGQMQYFSEMLPREGRDFPVGECIEPGTTKAMSGSFEPGEYLIYVPPHMQRGRDLSIGPRRARERRRVAVLVDEQGGVNVEEDLSLDAGEVEFQVTSRFPTLDGFLVRSRAPEPNWVSAAYVASQQDFRDLFSGEFLAPDVSFALRNVALLFTDIKGSTETYERVGDARAYALVKDHFAVLSEVIRAHEGGIVKTIGDAVMAAFPTTAEAVRAALAIPRALRAGAERVREVEVKVGVHCGPTIAVTSNRSLDYFGRTVNLAARVQNEAGASEVVLSEAVSADPAVVALLAAEGLAPERRRARLKGITGEAVLHALRP